MALVSHIVKWRLNFIPVNKQ